MRKFILGLTIGFLISSPVLALSASNFVENLKGKILLAIEDKGKTYYVANDGYRYRITAATAQKVFEKLALGITNSNLAKIPEKDLGIVPEVDSESASAPTSPASTNITIPSVAYIAGSNGSISGDSSQTVSKGSATTPVTAVPNAGYHFVKWSDGATAISRTDVFNISISYTAYFVANVFSCGQTFTDSRDLQLYPTVQIGSQCWFANNLAYLPFVDPAYSLGSTKPHYYVYGYNGINLVYAKSLYNYITYGVLYNYVAALTACPSGWHLPSDTEWTTLSNYLGGSNVTGDKLKVTRSNTPTYWDGTNDVGFNALPAGSANSTFNNLGIDTDFRSTWEDGNYDAQWHLYSEYPDFIRSSYMNKHIGTSVRCLKD